jgi:antitoxin component YwqK of YwqJK toxin-antitoxin module
MIKSEGNRKNHMLDSIWLFYNELGDTLQKVSYIMGKRNGFVIEYNVRDVEDPIDKGKVVSRELYVNDRKEGRSFYYYDNGRLREEVEYAANKRNGISKEFDNEGMLITIQRYNNGVLVERERINRVDNAGLKQGVWRNYYENGRTMSEGNYKDNVLNGPYKEYDESGNLKVMFQYSQGVMLEEADTADLDIDIRNEYDNEGNIVYTGSYRKEIPVGIHRVFDKSGTVINGYLYSDEGVRLGEGIITAEGKKEGDWKYFSEDGQIRSSGKYANNLETGKWKYFYKNGKAEQEGVFKNGKVDGLWQWYYINGGVKREEEYFEGREEGIYVEYDSVGEVITKGTYFDGQREGEWFYKVGDYSEKGKYIGDLKDGKWEAFYNDGKLKYEGKFIQGNPDEEHIYYYNNGKIKEITYYVMGIAVKNWKKYDENGNLLLTITYRDNKEYRINGEKIEFEQDDIRLIQ